MNIGHESITRKLFYYNCNCENERVERSVYRSYPKLHALAIFSSSATSLGLDIFKNVATVFSLHSLVKNSGCLHKVCREKQCYMTGKICERVP